MVKLKVLIGEFSKRHHIENLTADEEGVYTITFDDHIEVRCFEKFDSVYFTSVLDTLDKEQALGWLRRLLNYAFMRMKHSAVTPALDADHRVLLHTRFELNDLNIYEFEEALERYVNAFEEYRHFLSRTPQSPLSASQTILKP